jgi:6-phosphogluconolactonase (cycloisomerase 2 family)
MKWVLVIFLVWGCSPDGQKLVLNKFSDTSEDWVLLAIEAASGNGLLANYSLNNVYGLMDFTTSLEVGDDPVDITVSRSYSYAYVANSTSGTLSVVKVDKSTGALTMVETISGLTGISSLAIKFQTMVYAGYAGGVQVYNLDPNTGALTANGSVVSFGGAVTGLFIGVNEIPLYVSVGNTLHEAILATTGTITTGSSKAFTTLEFITSSLHRTSGKYMGFVGDSGANAVNVYEVNTTTGVLTLLQSNSVSNPKAIYFDGSREVAIIKDSTGTMRVYKVSNAGVLTLSFTRSQVTDTILNKFYTCLDGTLLLTMGATGIYSWGIQTRGTTTGADVIYRRKHAFTSLGTQVNAMGFVDKN